MPDFTDTFDNCHTVFISFIAVFIFMCCYIVFNAPLLFFIYWSFCDFCDAASRFFAVLDAHSSEGGRKLKCIKLNKMNLNNLGKRLHVRLSHFTTKEELTYGDDSRIILFACVDEGDRWFTNTSLGDVWTTWSTKCPTEDGRNRFLSWVNAALRLNRERAVVHSSIYLSCLFNYNPQKEAEKCLISITMNTICNSKCINSKFPFYLDEV